MTDLPVNIDATYADASPGDAAHQQHHDVLHALNNTVKASTFNVLDYGAVGPAESAATNHATIQAALDAADAAGGGRVAVPFGGQTVTIDAPLVVGSNTVVDLMGTHLQNVHDGSGQAQTGCVFYTGNFTVPFLHVNGGSMAYDTLSALPAAGDGSVVLSTTTLGIAAGDLVVVYTDETTQSASDSPATLHRVTDVSGSTVSLDPGFVDDHYGTTAYITDCTGETVNVTPVGRASYTVPSHVVQRSFVQNGRLTSDTNSWTARNGLLDGGISDLRMDSGRQLIYGNAWTRCRMSNITGTYTRRMIELSDGARLNVLDNIQGTYLEAGEDLAGQPAIKLGAHDTLTNWTCIDTGAARSGGPVINIVDPGVAVRSGRLLTDLGSQNIIGIGSSSLRRMDRVVVRDVNIETSGTVTFALVSVANGCEGATLSNLHLRAGGYSGAGVSVRLRDACANIVLDRIDADGDLDLDGTLTVDRVDVDHCRFAGWDNGDLDDHWFTVKGRGNTFDDREELERTVGTIFVDNSTITATTETVAVSDTFSVDQVATIGDVFEWEALITKVGTGGTLRFKVTFGGATIADVTTATTNGDYTVKGRITCRQRLGTIWSSEVAVHGPGGTTNVDHARLTGVNLTTTGGGIAVSAWKSSAGDTFTLRSVDWRPNLLLGSR